MPPEPPTYDGPERRLKIERRDAQERRANWPPFDCERDCLQHGKTILRVDNLEDEHKELEGKCSALDKRIDAMMAESVKTHKDQDDVIATKVPVKHALASITILLALFYFIDDRSQKANQMVADSNKQIGDKLEKKLDDLTTKVIRMEASAASQQNSKAATDAIVLEVQRMSAAVVKAVEMMERRDAQRNQVPP